MSARTDLQKALELILYVAKRLNQPGFHNVSKVLYFADREHLQHYGRLMAADRYIAMQHGPVPSGAYDVMKYARNGPSQFFNLPAADDALSVVGNHDLVPLRDADPDALSDSERECLDEAIRRYGDLPFKTLTQMSHDKAWHSADESEAITLDAIVDSLSGSDDLREYLRDPYPED